MARWRNRLVSQCPVCNCDNIEIVHASARRGMRVMGECQACEEVFSLIEIERKKPAENGHVKYASTRCAYCNSPDNTTTKTENIGQSHIRRTHRCKKCGRAFKSLEDRSKL